MRSYASVLIPAFAAAALTSLVAGGYTIVQKLSDGSRQHQAQVYAQQHFEKLVPGNLTRDERIENRVRITRLLTELAYASPEAARFLVDREIPVHFSGKASLDNRGITLVTNNSPAQQAQGMLNAARYLQITGGQLPGSTLALAP